MGFVAQRRQEDLLARGDRELKMLAFAQASVRHERMAAHYQHVASRAKDRIREQSSEIKRSGHRVRLPVFATALVLIAAGFLLQILGSWPGGVAFLGALAN